MNSLSTLMRPYKGESDLQPLIDLFDACDRVDKLELSVSISQLRRSLADPSIDRDRDLRCWEDTDGKLIGFARVSIEEPTQDNLADGSLWLIVDPIARNGEIEQQAIAWAENRMHEVGRERQGQPKLFTWSRSSQTQHIATIEHHGFVESRQFLHSSQFITKPIPKPQLPEGFTIRPVNGEQEAQKWVDLHNQCFINQWNYHPQNVARYHHRLQSPDYLPALDLVAVDADGKFASICYCSINQAHNTFIGRKEGWVVLLFTSPDFHRRGLARAILFHALEQLKSLNIEIANIGVDAENAFGARKLYESVGFEHRFTDIAYVKHL